MSEQTTASKFFERVLVGTIEAIARAGAKAVESITHDAKTALRKEAAKVEALQQGVEAWRKLRLGDVDDLPGSLRDDPADTRVGASTSESTQQQH